MMAAALKIPDPPGGARRSSKTLAGFGKAGPATIAWLGFA
jgi:hypothetical protein